MKIKKIKKRKVKREKKDKKRRLSFLFVFLFSIDIIKKYETKN
jgi:hypothetical protein